MALIVPARRQRRKVFRTLKQGAMFMTTLASSSQSLPRTEKNVQLTNWHGLGRSSVEPKLRNGRPFARSVDPFDDHAASPGTVAAFFCKYCDGEGSAVSGNNLRRLWKDVGVSGADVRALAILWRLQAERTDSVSRKSFVEGCLDLNTDSIERLRRELPNLLYDARRNFKDFYRYAYRVEAATLAAHDSTTSATSPPISREDAVRLWRAILPLCSGDATKFDEAWYGFLQERGVATIGESCWRAFLRFSQAVELDLTNFQAVAADWWPSLLSDFVADQLTNQRNS